MRLLLLLAGAAVGAGAVEATARDISTAAITAAAVAAVAGGEGAETGPVSIAGTLTLRVPGEPTLVAEPLTKATSGRLPVRVRALVDGQEAGRVLVTVPVRILRSAAVLAVPVAKGTVLGLEHLRQERVEVGFAITDLIASPPEAVGRIAQRDLPAGTPLRAGLVSIPALIKPGPITLVYRRHGIELSGSGDAVASGRQGDIIQVRRPDGRLMRAQVVGPALALVNYELSAEH